jgi:plasmid segregation protein ParM
VSGLPIAFYEDKEKLKSIMEGEHNFKCKTMFSIMVNNARIIPQPFGTILDNVLDEDGDIIDEKIARGTVGVIDVGGKTTNILSATALAEKSRMTTSINVGGWDVVRAVKKRLSVTMPELDLRDHEIAQGVINGYVRAYGKNVDITEIINTTALPFAQNIVSEATQLWGTGASLDMIIVTGGGSYLVGSVIVSKFRHATISSDPIFSNVVGYFKLSRRLNK